MDSINPRTVTSMQVSLTKYPTKYIYQVPQTLAQGGWLGGGAWADFGARGKRSAERARRAQSRINKRRNKRK